MSEHRELTFKEHLRTRALYGGSAVASLHDVWDLKTRSKLSISYGDAMLNMMDELLVNMVDHYVRSGDALIRDGGPVKNMWASLDTDGLMRFTNDGPGIPVKDKWDGQKEYCWLPEAIISHERVGSNFNDKTDPDRLTGGINGLGVKVANAASDELGVETNCLVHKRYYRQTCRERMEYIDPPTVIDLPNGPIEFRKSGLTREQVRQHTSFWTLPSYDVLNQIEKGISDVGWFKKNIATVEILLRLRVYQIAAFIGSIEYMTKRDLRSNYAGCNVWFKAPSDKVFVLINAVINTSNVRSGRNPDLTFDIGGFMKLLGLSNSIQIVFKGDQIQYPWVIGIGLVSEMDRVAKSKEEVMSIINGIHITDGGSHTTLMIGKICEGLSKLAKMEVTESMFRKVFCYFDVRQFPFRQIDFKGQTKQKLIIGKADLNRMREQYELNDIQVKSIWDLASKELKFMLETKAYAEQLKSSRSKNLGPIRKFNPPEIKGPKSAIFCAEGDTALQIVRDMIKSKFCPLDKRYFGTYSLQGVPPNAMKMIRVVKLGEETIIRADNQLLENITFRGLMRACGLDFGCKYLIKTLDGDKEFAKLNGSYIVLTTDQDLDGVGQICTLVIVFIFVFWPDLIKRGFIKRFVSPLIRVYCRSGPDKGKVFEFSSEREYEKWCMIKFGTIVLPSGYTAEYYKGLGGHTKDEVVHMGRTIEKNIYTVGWDDACSAWLNAMYGEDTEARKEMLMTPVVETYPESTWTTRYISLTTHLLVEAKEYQLMNMRRKLRSCIDGLIPTQRKVLCGVRKMFNGTTKKAKVFQVGGYVAKELHYGQGDTSMNGVIKKLAQDFEGACNLPICVPISAGFGSNVEGRAVSGGDRYLDTKYNSKIMDIIYPRIDDWLLGYNIEDGVQVEPKYYVPIVPMAILESENTTGHGWKIDLTGRDFEWTLAQLRREIGGYPALSLMGHPWFKSRGLEVRMENGREVCYGSWVRHPELNQIEVTQLPYRIWSYPFECHLIGINPATGKDEHKDAITGEVTKLKKKPYIVKVKDDTNNNQNEVKIWLEPGAWERIEENYGTETMDCVEHFLDLRHILIMNLNMIAENGYVREFDNYNDVMQYWFPMRRDLYLARIERTKLLEEYKLMFYKEKLRFILLDGQQIKGINIDKDFTKLERDTILAGADFIRFNETVLFTPGYLKADQLYAAIFEDDATYKYISKINVGDKSQDEIAVLCKTIEDMERDLAELSKATWQKLWLDDLDRLERMVKLGLATGWKYDEEEFTFVDGATDFTPVNKKIKAKK